MSSPQYRFNLDRIEAFLREDFVDAPANAEAVRALDAWPAWHGGCLALAGPEGSGKSHLAAVWAMAAGAATIPAHGPVDLDALRGRPVLYEDADRASPERDETLFHLINMAAEPGGALLVTGRTAPSAWRADLPDLRSRLNALPVAQLLEPDDIVLEAMLRKFFRERNIRPNEEVYPYLVRRIERSAPAALAVVQRLDAVGDAQGRNISRTLARQILESEPSSLDLFDETSPEASPQT